MQTDERVHPIKLLLRNHWPPISQTQLARRVGLADATVGRYLNFKQAAPDSFYRAVASALDVEESAVRPTPEPEPIVA